MRCIFSILFHIAVIELNSINHFNQDPVQVIEFSDIRLLKFELLL